MANTRPLRENDPLSIILRFNDTLNTWEIYPIENGFIAEKLACLEG